MNQAQSADRDRRKITDINNSRHLGQTNVDKTPFKLEEVLLLASAVYFSKCQTRIFHTEGLQMDATPGCGRLSLRQEPARAPTL